MIGAPFIHSRGLSNKDFLSCRENIERQLDVLERISEFAFSQNDDVSIGIQRLWYSPRVCNQCGKTDDFVMGLSCDCWISAEDVFEGEQK